MVHPYGSVWQVVAKPPNLSATDWAHEALTVIGESGLAAVAVEPLAKRLRATKGSFYWHYANRQALIAAALGMWERDHTEAVIAALDTTEGARERLRSLLVRVVEYGRNDKIEVALLASAQDPLVAGAIHRVTQRRIDYVASLFQEMGDEPDLALRRATLAVSVYLGHTQLAHVSTDLIPTGDQWRHYRDELVRALVDG